MLTFRNPRSKPCSSARRTLTRVSTPSACTRSDKSSPPTLTNEKEITFSWPIWPIFPPPPPTPTHQQQSRHPPLPPTPQQHNIKAGLLRYVHVDDRLPCNQAGALHYARGLDINEVWVPIVEKVRSECVLYSRYLWLTILAVEQINGDFGCCAAPF